MKTRPPESLSPDSDLYIYYFEGRLPRQVAIRDAAFIGNWEEEGFSFLFFRCPAEKAVHRLVTAHPALRLLDSYRMTYAEWQGDRVEPVRTGRFLLRPPWIDVPLDSNDIEVILDPGVVFGTGTHPTTRDCLTAIDRICAADSIDRMLDLGTGTGVLALAAAKLGCRQAVAVDFNFLAASTTLGNVHRNHLEDRILVINGQAGDFVNTRADLLVANIHYAVMRQLVRTAGFFEKKWFVLSGLLRSEAKSINDYLANQPVKVLDRWDRDGIWHTLLGKTGSY